MAGQKLTLVNKIEISPQVFFLTYTTTLNKVYTPGQFLSFRIAPKVVRAYSVVEYSQIPPVYYPQSTNLEKLTDNYYISFMISTKSGGEGSKYFASTKVGDEIDTIGPSGKFSLRVNDRPKIFVSTGTGLAPFVPMIKQNLATNSEQEMLVYFGSWNRQGCFAGNFIDSINQTESNLKLINVIDEFKPEDLDEDHLGGRVTTVIPENIKDLASYDYYLCGHPAMVTDMEKVLLENQVSKENIFTEKYG